MAKTELFVRRTPGGVFTINREDLCTGSIFFVNSATGTDAAGYGSNPDSPVATVDYAVGLCTASKGDRIYVMPGHAEDIIAAGTLTLDKIGVEVIGLGRGALRPTFTFKTADTATILVSAAQCRLTNLVFNQAGIDAIATGINITAADAEVDHCKFICSATDKKALKSVVFGAGSTGAKVHHCEFAAPVTEAVNALYCGAAIDNIQITDNRFYGYWSGNILLNDTAAMTNLHFSRNEAWILHATGILLTVHATATGIVSFNNTYVTKNIGAGGSLSAAACSLFENYAMELAHAGTSAQLDPAAGAWA